MHRQDWHLHRGAHRLERHVDVNGRDNEDVLRVAYLNSHFEPGSRVRSTTPYSNTPKSTSARGASSTKYPSISNAGGSRYWWRTAANAAWASKALRKTFCDYPPGIPMRQEKIIRSMTQPARASTHSTTTSPAMAFECSASPAAKWRRIIPTPW